MMAQSKPKNRESKTKVLPPCRVSEHELATIKSKAKQCGMTLSEYQRQACLNSVVIVRESIGDQKLIYHLSAIGNNLNQLVRKTHLHDESDTTKMREILSIIDKIIMGVVDDPEN